MIRTHRPWLAWVAGSVLLLVAMRARAIYLDQDDNITLRARIYSQAAIRIQNSAIDTAPETKSGQLVQQRNFFNPELDAKLTPYLTWMNSDALSWLHPDDLRFRIAAWGFYDGIYDYGSSQFNNSQKVINDSFDNNVKCQGTDPTSPACPFVQIRAGGWFVRGPNIKLPKGGASATTFSQVFPGYDLYTPRSIYGNSERVNELYISYSKGPFFLRFGKQSISWGESDTIALLDQSNPFDLTLAAPGFFEDIDEARIPLYTVRASYNLFDTLGPLSSGFIESYWVPGELDSTTAITPLLTASPYSPRGQDPQTHSSGIFPPSYQFVFFDHTLKSDFSSSRWGFRFQTVLNRFLTLQTWVYRTFPSSPVPVEVGFPGTAQIPVSIGPPDTATNFYIISLEHKPVMVYGLAGTFFFEPIDSIVRLDAQFFEHEAGFVPQANLNICAYSNQPGRTCPNGKGSLNSAGFIPYEDVLRYEIGLDRFFFLRALNPSNSFVVSASAVGSYNSSWTNSPAHDFRFNGQLKPGYFNSAGQEVTRGKFANDYVNQDGPLDAQGQITVQTDYLHGRLEPRLTVIQFVRGTNAIHPTLSYRWTDWLLFQADYQRISGAYQSLGFFRDRDQVSFRVTYQLN